MPRVILPELLDAAPDAEAVGSVHDLVRINRYLGGYSTVRRLFARVVKPGESFTVLDVGAASGDMGAAIRKSFPGARITSLDYKRNHLAQAPFPKLQGDAFLLPFAPASFDFVFSSLFLHHFDDAAVVSLLRGFGVVARRAVLAIDLDRGPFAYRFIPATRWLFHWHPITLHDAPVSVQAAFHPQELASLARAAGLSNPAVRVHRPWSRLSLIAVSPRVCAVEVGDERGERL